MVPIFLVYNDNAESSDFEENGKEDEMVNFNVDDTLLEISQTFLENAVLRYSIPRLNSYRQTNIENIRLHDLFLEFPNDRRNSLENQVVPSCDSKLLENMMQQNERARLETGHHFRDIQRGVLVKAEEKRSGSEIRNQDSVFRDSLPTARVGDESENNHKKSQKKCQIATKQSIAVVPNKEQVFLGETMARRSNQNLLVDTDARQTSSISRLRSLWSRSVSSRWRSSRSNVRVLRSSNNCQRRFQRRFKTSILQLEFNERNVSRIPQMYFCRNRNVHGQSLNISTFETDFASNALNNTESTVIENFRTLTPAHSRIHQNVINHISSWETVRELEVYETESSLSDHCVPDLTFSHRNLNVTDSDHCVPEIDISNFSISSAADSEIIVPEINSVKKKVENKRFPKVQTARDVNECSSEAAGDYKRISLSRAVNIKQMKKVQESNRRRSHKDFHQSSLLANTERMGIFNSNSCSPRNVIKERKEPQIEISAVNSGREIPDYIGRAELPVPFETLLTDYPDETPYVHHEYPVETPYVQYSFSERFENYLVSTDSHSSLSETAAQQGIPYSQNWLFSSNPSRNEVRELPFGPQLSLHTRPVGYIPPYRRSCPTIRLTLSRQLGIPVSMIADDDILRYELALQSLRRPALSPRFRDYFTYLDDHIYTFENGRRESELPDHFCPPSALSDILLGSLQVNESESGNDSEEE